MNKRQAKKAHSKKEIFISSFVSSYRELKTFDRDYHEYVVRDKRKSEKSNCKEKIMKIAVKEVGKELRLVEVSDQYRDNCVKVFTGKKDSAQYIGLNSNGTLCIGVNEAGLLYNMPLNFYIATTSKHFPIQKIVGTAVFVRTKYANPWVQDIYDFEVEDLTEEDVKLIENILGETHQKQLMENFEDYGNGFVVIEKL